MLIRFDLIIEMMMAGLGFDRSGDSLQQWRLGVQQGWVFSEEKQEAVNTK